MNLSRLKICGLRTEEAVSLCVEARIGFVGFIAYESSIRHIDPITYAALCAFVSDATKRVLVTVNASDAWLDSYIGAYIPDILQLHGEESPDHCLELKKRYNLPIIKAIAVADTSDLMKVNDYAESADFLLFDTKAANGSSGGTGQAFDWTLLQNMTTHQPYFLSGGLGEDNIQDAIAITHAPYFDVSSSLEEPKGIKHPAKINHFLNHFLQL